MLKFINLNIPRVATIVRRISTTKTSYQTGELTTTKEKSESITSVTKKERRLPLAKNFFLGQIDTELASYPEAVCETDHYNAMLMRRKEYDDFLESQVFANPNDEDNIRKMKEFGCFRNTSAILTDTMFSVYESEAKVLSYSTFLNNHQQVLRMIIDHGDASLKLKYLSKLENGDLIGVPCFYEAHLPESKVKLFKTQAHYKDATDEYILNGSKDYVLLSPAYKNNKLFLVLASIETVDPKTGDFKEGVTAFLVEGNTPGVDITTIDKTLGYDEKPFDQVTVTFDNVTLKNCKISSVFIAK
jgi:alkylation response protein AidB-like acyl-CoA dehydrogenase